MKKSIRDKNIGAIKVLSEDQTLALFSILRSYLEHEDGLINQRTTWFLMLNSFLFTAVALLSGVNASDSVFSELQIAAIVMILAGVGSITSILSWISISAAYNSIKAIKDLWIDKYEPDAADYGAKETVSDEGHGVQPRFDPKKLLPYIKGGGPNNHNALKGRYVAYTLFFGIFVAWILIFLVAADVVFWSPSVPNL